MSGSPVLLWEEVVLLWEEAVLLWEEAVLPSGKSDPPCTQKMCIALFITFDFVAMHGCLPFYFNPAVKLVDFGRSLYRLYFYTQ